MKISISWGPVGANKINLLLLFLDQKDPNLDQIFAEKSIFQIVSQLKVEWFKNIEWFQEESSWPGIKVLALPIILLVMK